jgi:hypothetical protein
VQTVVKKKHFRPEKILGILRIVAKASASLQVRIQASCLRQGNDRSDASQVDFGFINNR